MTLLRLVRGGEIADAFRLARALSGAAESSSTGTVLTVVLTRAIARLSTLPQHAHVWSLLRRELVAMSTESPGAADVGAYRHYLAAARASLAQNAQVALPQWLIDTLLWSSGSAAEDEQHAARASRGSGRPPAPELVRAFLQYGLLIEACEACSSMLADAVLRNQSDGELPSLPETLLNEVLAQCRRVTSAQPDGGTADYRILHLRCALSKLENEMRAFTGKLRRVV
jgi:hypothetical protein